MPISLSQEMMREIIMDTEFGIKFIAGANGFSKIANLNVEELEYFAKFIDREVEFLPEIYKEGFIIGHTGNYLYIKFYPLRYLLQLVYNTTTGKCQAF